MTPAARLALALVALAAHVPASAQERVIQDTLSADTPTAVTCGFCATERFGVIFRELPAGRRGIEPTDFPIRLESVQIALAAATVSGASCTPSASGGTIIAPVELYVGDDAPTGAISSLPADGPWSASETLVWAADAPLTLSTSPDGGRYQVDFNELIIRDDADMPITIERGTYLRVVVTLPAAEPTAACTGDLDQAAGYPFRDSDGRIADERGFIYASGVGWLWNEQASVAGDWGLRLSLFRSTAPRDAGMPPSDAGTTDAGTTDAGATIDAGSDAGALEPGGGGGCSCRAAGPTKSSPWALALAILLVLRRSSARRAHS